MTVQHFKRADRPYKYIAARLGSPFDPLPSWFHLLEKTCTLRYDDERNVEVRTITGNWRTVEQGDWVVLQQGGNVDHVGFDKPNVFHVQHEDFIKLWDCVSSREEPL